LRYQSANKLPTEYKKNHNPNNMLARAARLIANLLYGVSAEIRNLCRILLLSRGVITSLRKMSAQLTNTTPAIN
jgi:hypothetical protein